jgi:hypothetical protein
MPIIAVNVYRAKKGPKSPAERRTEELLQQVSAEAIPIFSFIMTRRISERVALYDSRGRPLLDRNGNARSEVRVTYLKDKFYSKNRELLFSYYRELLARNFPNTSIDWLDSRGEVSENIGNKVDNRILQTKIDPNTNIETIYGYM